MAKKHCYAFAMLHLAERVNKMELYEECLDLLVKIVQTSSIGSCNVIVSIVATLMNLNRLEEAYGIIISQMMNKNDFIDVWPKDLKTLAPPEWFNLKESK